MPTRKPRAAALPRRRAESRPRAAVAKPQAAKSSSNGLRSGAADDFYRDLVWSLRNGVLAVTVDGRVAVMNDVAYRILGLPPRRSDIGRPFTGVLQGQPEVARIIAGAFEMSHLPNRAELRLKSSNKVIGYTISQVQDARGRVTGATLFFKDLTRVEQLEERERLRDRLAALGEMAAAIAHEVKNPLAGIEVMAGILKRQLPDSKDAQSILGDIIKEAKMANAIVLEVLEFVRPIRLQVERMSLLDVITDAIALAEGQAPRGNVDVHLSVPQDLATIQGDPHQLRQLFTNLLINAFEAMNGRGTVRIDATELPEEEPPTGGETLAGPMIQVDVIDDGPGVPADVVDKIFSPFFTTKPQGTGLGLAIVRKIVNAHDGRIDMNAPAAGGTQFRVTLPVSSTHELFR
ncbi:MAG TPA: ATP-binding protein [Vicinamibacterales bacterium]|nr:ATP-binding protein [Vicinamibacterales bacterium]